MDKKCGIWIAINERFTFEKFSINKITRKFICKTKIREKIYSHDSAFYGGFKRVQVNT